MQYDSKVHYPRHTQGSRELTSSVAGVKWAVCPCGVQGEKLSETETLLYQFNSDFCKVFPSTFPPFHLCVLHYTFPPGGEGGHLSYHACT